MTHPTLRHATRALLALLVAAPLWLTGVGAALAGDPPGAGDVIFNEYASDNDAAGNDFVELLVVRNNLDLRGLRIADNELAGGVLNNGESVLVFGNDSYLDNLPAGTLIAVWTVAAGVTPDTTVDPASGDWKLVLAPGAGVEVSTDGLGGSANTGLSTGGEALYVYLPGADGASTGADNVYLDFVSFESDGGEAPAGLVDLNLPSVADNAYYFGNTAAGNDLAANWVAYDGIPSAHATPGDPNPTQDLNGLRGGIVVDPAPRVLATTPANGATGVAIDANLVVDFSEAVAPSGEWFQIACATSGTRPAGATTVVGGPVTYTIDPAADFANGESCTVTLFAAQVADVDANDPPDTMAADATFTFTTAGLTYRIRDIQGAGHTSPLVAIILDNASSLGLPVSDVAGIVTALRSNGFYMQDPAPDADSATSEGIFVFTRSAPAVAPGDAVLVTGQVAEFRTGCTSSSCTPASSAWPNLTATQINSAGITKLSSGNALPAPTVIGQGGRVPPTQVIHNDPTAPGASVETDPVAKASFEPDVEGLDFYESLEGMLVQVNNAVAVGPTVLFGSGASANREIPVLADGGAGQGLRTPRGGIIIAANDFNPERIILGDALNATNPDLPTVNVGDSIVGPIVGVLDYSFANFKLWTTGALPPVTPAGLAKQGVTLAAPGADELSIATLNVENLGGDAAQSRFDALAQVIVANLQNPDILALQEIQDNNGTISNTVVAADVTLGRLVSAVSAAGGPAYQFRQIDPVNLQDGGAPGGNIRVAYLFRTDRGISFTDRPGADALTANAVLNNGGVPELQFNPGRIDPANVAFFDSRKPLAAEFAFGGRKLFLVNNHFNSKGGDQPLFGRFQLPVLFSEVQRMLQAQIVAGFVNQVRAVDPNARIVVLGDLNDFDFSAPISVLEGAGLTTLIERLPANERYSYNFQGNAQTLDHIMVSAGVLNGAGIRHQVVHLNSEFADQLSDHDPQIMRLALNQPTALVARGAYDTGLGANGAEIVDLRGTVGALTNAGDGSFDLLDTSNLLAIAATRRITGVAGLNSLAIHPTQEYLLAVAGTSSPAAAPVAGKVRAYRLSDGAVLAEGATGILPDSIDISPDGRWAVIANEAEGFAANDNGGPGSLTVIDLAAFNPAAPTPLAVTQVALPAQTGAPGFTANRIDDLARLPIDNTPGTLEPETVAFTPDSQYAYISLQENNAVLRYSLLDGSLVFAGLGQTTHAVDATNGDGFNPNRRLTLFREPDGVAIVEFGGVRYFVTADEGDTRDDIPAGSGTGRVRGGRTVSVFDAATGQLVGDTGNQLDALAARFGRYPDNRSDRGGSEPEVLDATVFAGRALVAVGLERGNAVALVDITNPASPQAIQLIPGDTGPEGIKFAAQSANLFVLAANEVSGTLTVATVPVQPFALTQTGSFRQPLALYDVQAIDADAGDVVTVMLHLSNPAAGTLATGSSASATFGGDPATGQYVARGAVGGVNELLAGLVFQPAADYVGTVELAITAGDGLAAPATGTLTIVYPAPGAATITIELDATPESNRNFRFVGAFGDFQLDDPPVDDGDRVGKRISFQVNYGRYKVTEVPPASWFVTEIACTGGGTRVDLAQNSVTFDLNGGENVTCIFRNDFAANVTARKYFDSNGDGQRTNERWLQGWEIQMYNSAGQRVFSSVTNNAGRVDFKGIRPGPYTVCEKLKEGWINTQPGARNLAYGNQPCYDFTLLPGQTVTFFFGNVNDPKVVAPAGADVAAIVADGIEAQAPVGDMQQDENYAGNAEAEPVAPDFANGLFLPWLGNE